LIPVFEPNLTESDIEAVTAALRRGEISGSFGQALGQFEAEFARYCGCKHGVAVSSGTTALHLAVAAAGIGPGDEVLVSSCTNVATALAAFHNGAVPVPVDSEDVTWNLDLDLIEGLVTPRTRAIIPVHLYGHPVDMDRLEGIARRLGLRVIEDCAESHGATVRGRKTGSFGDMACFSFYANKVITTGEGGMVTTNDDALAERLRLLRNLAFTTPRFRHEAAGYNFRMTGYQGALGLSQLRRIEQIIAEKRRVAQSYRRHLAGLRGLRLPVELEFGISRDALASRLQKAGIETRTFFCGMNQQPFLRSQPGYREIACPVADRLWERGLYLPSGASLGEPVIETISAEIRRAGRP
jgi:perosamine synthetase